MNDNNTYVDYLLTEYSDTVYRICYMYLHHKMDAEDAFQEIFIKLMTKPKTFENSTHERAWIIRVSINTCKDFLRSVWFKRVEKRETVEIHFKEAREETLIGVVKSLPKKYMDVIYLYYYEGYSVPEMANLLKKNENTIYAQLHRAKGLLKEKLEANDYGYTHEIST